MKRLPLTALTLFVLTGCATGSDIQKLQRSIEDLQDQVAELKRNASSKDEVQKISSTIVQQTQTLLKSNADMSVKVSEIDDKLQNAQGAIEQTNYRLDRLAQQVDQTQKEVTDLRSSTRPSTPATGDAIQDEINVRSSEPSEDPLQTYQAAYRDYQLGHFDLAIAGFQDYLKKFPATDLSDNAGYWIGESYFSQQKYREAIQRFDAVINDFPKSDKVPAALLKKGYSYIQLGEKAQGIVQLQYVIHEHPRSTEATLAKQRLKSLGIETR